MSEKLCAFFGIPVPEPARALVSAAVERIEEHARRARPREAPRFSPPEKYHVTSKFLGWVPVAGIDALWNAALPIAARTPPIDARVGPVTTFGSIRRARVLFAHVEPQEPLAELAHLLEDAAETLGIAREDRPYRPHVTLARLKRPADVTGWLAAAELAPTPTHLSTLRLYRSDLGPDGGRYTVLFEAGLGG